MTFTISSIFTILFGFNTLSDSVKIPDSSFEKALVKLKIDSDGKINGKVSVKDVREVKKLYVDDLAISDLTGIKEFINLETLNCKYNKLDSIDVRGLTKLKILNIGGNKIRSIDKIDGSNIEGLEVFGNKFTEIDLTKYKKLKYFDGGGNSFFKIDFSQNSEIERVNLMFNNRIDTLDFSINHKLKSLMLRDIGLKHMILSKSVQSILADRNKLEHLDVSMCDSLYYLDLESNRISSINLDRNKLIITLSLNNNNLESIDLSKNLALKNISLRSNKVTKNSFKYSSLPNLENLVLESNPLFTFNGKDFPSLKTINLNWTRLDTLDLSHNYNLEELHFERNKIDRLDLSHNIKLKKIAAYHNNIGELILPESIIEIGASGNPIKEIDLRNKKLITSLHVQETLIEEVDCSECSKIYYLGCDNIPTLKKIILPKTPVHDFSLRKDSSVKLFNIHKDFEYAYNSEPKSIDYKRHSFTKKKEVKAVFPVKSDKSVPPKTRESTGSFNFVPPPPPPVNKKD